MISELRTKAMLLQACKLPEVDMEQLKELLVVHVRDKLLARAMSKPSS